jgi:DNA-binding response OmpR family regulator
MFTLLEYLMRNAGMLLTRQMILDTIKYVFVYQFAAPTAR